MPGISGKNLKCRIGATPVYGTTDADINDTADELDATDAESDGLGDSEIGVQQLEFGFSGFCRPNQGTVPLLRTGLILTNVRIYVRGLTGSYWSIPSAIVLNFTNPVRVRGRVEFTARVKSKGAYSYVNVDG